MGQRRSHFAGNQFQCLLLLYKWTAGSESKMRYCGLFRMYVVLKLTWVWGGGLSEDFLDNFLLLLAILCMILYLGGLSSNETFLGLLVTNLGKFLAIL